MTSWLASGPEAADGLLPYAFLFLSGWIVVSLFSRRVGGKGGGSEKASAGAWVLLAAIFLGILVATRG